MTDLVVIPKHTVIQYIRNKKRVPHGVIVAVKASSVEQKKDGILYKIGFSLCNKKDKFTKKMALKIAIDRTSDWVDGRKVIEGTTGYRPSRGPLPRDISRMFTSFEERCNKYYKVTT